MIAREIDFMNTPVSKVMTKNPIYVLSDTLAVEALQKMVQGKFRHLPVVENGEVIALLDIAKCLYDAIARMERAAEKGKAIAAAVEGVEKHWGTTLPGKWVFLFTFYFLLSTSLYTVKSYVIATHFSILLVIFTGPNTFVETLKERMFKPALSTIISDNSK